MSFIHRRGFFLTEFNYVAFCRCGYCNFQNKNRPYKFIRDVYCLLYGEMQYLTQLFHRHFYNTQTARKMVTSAEYFPVIYFFHFSVTMIITVVDNVLIMTLR